MELSCRNHTLAWVPFSGAAVSAESEGAVLWCRPFSQIQLIRRKRQLGSFLLSVTRVSRSWTPTSSQSVLWLTSFFVSFFSSEVSFESDSRLWQRGALDRSPERANQTSFDERPCSDCGREVSSDLIFSRMPEQIRKLVKGDE